MADASKLHSMLEKVGSPEDRDSNRPTLDIALGIVTVSRNRHVVDSFEPHYLTQVGSFDGEVCQWIEIFLDSWSGTMSTLFSPIATVTTRVGNSL